MEFNSFYNKVSDLEIQKGGYRSKKLEFFLGEIKKKADKKAIQILDLACNEGSLTEKYGKYGEIWGIDINAEAMKKAKAKKLNVILGDVFNIGDLFKGKKFDVVIAGDIIEHVFDTDGLIVEVKKILKQDGVLLLSTPNLLSAGRRAMALIGKNPYCEYSTTNDGINVGHIRYYTYKNIKDQLHKHKFKNITIVSDTLNFPVTFIDQFLVFCCPAFGRELYIRAEK